MTESVVDQLEAVEIDEEHRDEVAAAMQPSEAVAEPVEKQSPVRQAGQRIMQCLMCELFLDAPTSETQITAGSFAPVSQ